MDQVAEFHFKVSYATYKFVLKLGFEALLCFHAKQFSPFVWTGWPSYILGFLMVRVNMYRSMGLRHFWVFVPYNSHLLCCHAAKFLPFVLTSWSSFLLMFLMLHVNMY